ncbi:MAG: 2',3'-cyclic-nucleotide 2'-phosphodiesterase, partial [Lactobacillus johnsonii]|nr:2',3'-cyclic-nucleotide 2'-phosphodiesterase [Lactobacillus johnsonii]
IADFVKEFPENEHQHVHQFNLSKIDPTRLLHIW